MNKDKKKGLAIITAPKTLYDFLWYYEAYGKEKYEYDAIVMPYSYQNKRNDAVYQFCQNSGIFNDIQLNDETYVDKSLKDKLKIILEMLWYAVGGRQAKYCAKVMSAWFDYREYEQLISDFRPSIFLGEVLVMSEYLEVILLEDGNREYLPKRRFPTLKTIKEEGIEKELAGFVLSKLGYADTTTRYVFKPTKQCIKFATEPDKLVYRDYKKIYKLNDKSKVDMESYNNLVKKAFQFDMPSEKPDCVLFTASLNTDLMIEDMSCVNDIIKYISKQHPKGTVWLKKHPRDTTEYVFPEENRLIEIPATVPAEIFWDLVEDTEKYFLWPSTIIQLCRNDERVHILYLKDIENEKYNRNVIKEVNDAMNIDLKCVVEI